MTQRLSFSPTELTIWKKTPKRHYHHLSRRHHLKNRRRKFSQRRPHNSSSLWRTIPLASTRLHRTTTTWTRPRLRTRKVEPNARMSMKCRRRPSWSRAPNVNNLRSKMTLDSPIFRISSHHISRVSFKILGYVDSF